MHIFNIIDENTIKISDEIASELSNLNETDNYYNKYETISNECAVLRVYLYDDIATESIGDKLKTGLSYMMKLIHKIILMVGNGVRRLLKFLNISKGVLIIKRLDEENNEIEVNHPEVVKESELFWSNINFDDISEADVVSVEAKTPDDYIVKLKNTFLYRVLLISRIIQPKSTYTSLENIKGVDSHLKDIINRLNSKNSNKISSYNNLFDLIKEEVDELVKLNKKLMTTTDIINKDNSDIKDFMNKNILNSTLEGDIEKIANYLKRKENLEKHDSFISAIELRTSNSYSKRYISNNYVKVVLNMITSLNKYINKTSIQTLFKSISDLNSDNKKNIANSLRKIDANDSKNTDKSRKSFLNDLNRYYKFILNINIIINTIGTQVPKMLATARQAK